MAKSGQLGREDIKAMSVDTGQQPNLGAERRGNPYI